MRKLLAGVGIAGLMSLALSGTVMAGEYDGKGNDVPGGENGRSACSYSGQDVDDSVEGNPPGFDDDDITAVGSTRVQSYGIIVKAGGKAFAPSPGEACRPGRP